MRTAVRRHGRPLSWQGRAVLAALVALGTVAFGSALSLGGDGPPVPRADPTPVTADLSYWPTAAPQPPATSRPSRHGRSPASPSASPSGKPHPTPPVRSAPTPPRTTAAPSQPALRPGARVGLEPVTHPGFRVRHQHFAGRIDRIGARSTAGEKADATFTVRAGLADGRCVSLEAVNYPGFYLRHQDFALHLHRRDGSALFAADATFCPVAGLAGRDVSLRAYNYPDRYLSHQRSRLHITRPGDRAAMTFAIKAGL